jgi:hypothetical protein
VVVQLTSWAERIKKGLIYWKFKCYNNKKNNDDDDDDDHRLP